MLNSNNLDVVSGRICRLHYDGEFSQARIVAIHADPLNGVLMRLEDGSELDCPIDELYPLVKLSDTLLTTGQAIQFGQAEHLYACYEGEQTDEVFFEAVRLVEERIGAKLDNDPLGRHDWPPFTWYVNGVEEGGG